MNTSYFAKSASHPNAVAIALRSPPYFTGKQYKLLAPNRGLLRMYQQYKDVEKYTQQYYKEVLDKLDPWIVFKALGHDAVLLCWEGPNRFCHRHLVAQWIESTVGIKVTEL